MRKLFLARVIVASLCFNLPILAAAEALYQPSGNNLTLGNSSHGNGSFSLMSNPSAGAADSALPGAMKPGLGIAIGAGLEFGNVDEIFRLIDEISAAIDDVDDSSDDPVNLPSIPEDPSQLPYEPSWSDLLAESPEFQEWFSDVQAQSIFIASSIAIITQEAYAKAFATGDVPLYLTDDFAGGSLSLNFTAQGTVKARGIVDLFGFDADEALAQLELARNLDPDAPRTEFPLAEDIILIVDPSEEEVELDFRNDSLLLTKTARIYAFGASYSKRLFRNSKGAFFAGVEPKIYHVGLGQVDTRFGEITDAEALFEDIRNAELSYDNALSADIGALWVTENYLLGLTVNDITSPRFSFPRVDFDKYTDQKILRELRRESIFEKSLQGRIEAALYDKSQRLATHFSIDTNAVNDPMRDEYQWVVLGASLQLKSRWVPGFRVGYRENLAGTQLRHFSAGMSLLKILTLDISRTLDSVRIEDNTVPRGIGVSVGLNIAF